MAAKCYDAVLYLNFNGASIYGWVPLEFFDYIVL